MAAHRSPHERAALVRRWLASDLSAAAFAERHGVSVTSLHRWRRELASADRSSSPGFVEIVASGDPVVASPSAAPIVEIRLGGAAVLVPPGTDAATLGLVLDALRRHAS